MKAVTGLFDIKGEKPQWQAIYEHIETMQIGDEITIAELHALIPDAAANSVRPALYRARDLLEVEHHRTFDRVEPFRGKYRMVEPAEHIRLAARHQKRAGKQIKAAVRKTASADRTLLSHEDRARIDRLEMNLSRQADFNARMSRQVMAETRTRKAAVAEVSDRIDEVIARLARHGITDDETADEAAS